MSADNSLRRVARVFRHSDYARYTAGNSLSLIGLWMQRIGVGWLAWELTHSPTWLGIIAMTEFFPVIVMGPIGGVLADRFDRATNMILFQSVAMIASAALFLVVLMDGITIWILAGLTLTVGVASGLNSASRLALAPSLVPKEDLTIAIAVNSMVFNTARFVGPAMAGGLINIWGVEFAFACNALSYLTLIWALWTIRSKLAGPTVKKHPRNNVLTEMKEGVSIVYRNSGSRMVMIVMLFTAILLRPVVQLLPGIADDVIKAGVDGFAYLTATIGLGAIAGGYWMAQRQKDNTFDMALIGILVSVLSNAGLLSTQSLPPALMFAFFMGGSMVITGIGIQSTLQMSIPDVYRGRVLSLYGVCFMGGPALGALGIGIAAETFGFSAPVYFVSFVVLVVWTVVWPIRNRVRESLEELHANQA